MIYCLISTLDFVGALFPETGRAVHFTTIIFDQLKTLRKRMSEIEWAEYQDADCCTEIHFLSLPHELFSPSHKKINYSALCVHFFFRYHRVCLVGRDCFFFAPNLLLLLLFLY
jgi:hypothetical protein